VGLGQPENLLSSQDCMKIYLQGTAVFSIANFTLHIMLLTYPKSYTYIYIYIYICNGKAGKCHARINIYLKQG
jgi:hypothetical protein